LFSAPLFPSFYHRSKQLMNPEVPQALRLQAILANGVVIIYNKQAALLMDDASAALVSCIIVILFLSHRRCYPVNQSMRHNFDVKKKGKEKGASLKPVSPPLRQPLHCYRSGSARPTPRRPTFSSWPAMPTSLCWTMSAWPRQICFLSTHRSWQTRMTTRCGARAAAADKPSWTMICL
jgi:hypothetical protein